MDRQAIQAFVDQWKRAGPMLEQLREEDIRRTDTTASIGVFDGLVEDAIARFPPGPESGLIEMQRYFMRMQSVNEHQRSGHLA